MTTSTTHPQSIQGHSSLSEIINFAVNCRATHFAFGKPRRGIEGFKEVNIAHDLSAAFRLAGFYVFPEFPLAKGGSMDGVFIRGDEVVVCEWKQCYARSAWEVPGQTERMVNFNSMTEFQIYGFPDKNWEKRCLWVCDAWDDETINWWFGRSPVKDGFPPCPFDGNWNRDEYKFQNLGWNYSWIWAYTK
ncbi:MAG: hypothetical protein ABSF10_08430 [Verrucomicrobiota bacterium]|jgi:hypothetical protein